MSRESNDTWMSFLIYPPNTTQLEQRRRCYRTQVRTHHGSCRNSNTLTTRTHMHSNVHNQWQPTTVRPRWRCRTHTNVYKTTWHANTVYGNDNVAATNYTWLDNYGYTVRSWQYVPAVSVTWCKQIFILCQYFNCFIRVWFKLALSNCLF